MEPGPFPLLRCIITNRVHVVQESLEHNVEYDVPGNPTTLTAEPSETHTGGTNHPSAKRPRQLRLIQGVHSNTSPSPWCLGRLNSPPSASTSGPNPNANRVRSDRPPRPGNGLFPAPSGGHHSSLRPRGYPSRRPSPPRRRAGRLHIKMAQAREGPAGRRPHQGKMVTRRPSRRAPRRGTPLPAPNRPRRPLCCNGALTPRLRPSPTRTANRTPSSPASSATRASLPDRLSAHNEAQGWGSCPRYSRLTLRHTSPAGKESFLANEPPELTHAVTT
ncbi:PREDICTED: translation initiation factor IF-2-like [Calidris pugnax]|uniref:translation initiation factor IF-2-like n=1 Tax=Calidris pugnax TaxID=198806 RepID=UPI00071E4DD9|nr:PREDICTED: translation initiation factor IF-2-like [Calidris pugnax]